MKNSKSRTAARQMMLRRIVDRGEAKNQSEMVEALAKAGHPVTQATVSRDLAMIGATRELSKDGEIEYRLGADQVTRDAGERELSLRMKEFVIAIRKSSNLVLLRTPPGGAGPVAAALDRARLDGVLGTVGGDDTVLVIATETWGGEKLKSHLEQILES